jgi:Replication-relaxation
MPELKRLVSVLQFQDRDLSLLRGLFESRAMTTNHVMVLYFNGNKEAAKKRLQKLKAAEFISERPRRPFEPSVLFLTRKGLEMLQERGVLAEYPAFNLPTLDRRARVSDLTIRHELEVMDVKTAFHSAVKKFPAFSIAEFSTWPMLNQFRAYHPVNGAEIAVKPDGFIRFHEKEEGTKGYAHDFFLEVDRSTEVQDVLATRAACYFEYYKSGDFAVRNGAHRDDYKQFPFRVLMVFKTAERRNNTAERLLQNNLPTLKQVCLSTFEEVVNDPLGAIWFCPADYREATTGTSFAPAQERRAREYKRQTERDWFIENNIKKWRILSDNAEA